MVVANGRGKNFRKDIARSGSKHLSVLIVNRLALHVCSERDSDVNQYLLSHSFRPLWHLGGLIVDGKTFSSDSELYARQYPLPGKLGLSPVVDPSKDVDRTMMSPCHSTYVLACINERTLFRSRNEFQPTRALVVRDAMTSLVSNLLSRSSSRARDGKPEQL